MKFQHQQDIYLVQMVDELGYVVGKTPKCQTVTLHPKEAIRKLPTKAIRFFLEHWIGEDK